MERWRATRGADLGNPEIPENLRYYVDYEAITCNMGYDSEIEEIEREVIVTSAYEF